MLKSINQLKNYCQKMISSKRRGILVVAFVWFCFCAFVLFFLILRLIMLFIFSKPNLEYVVVNKVDLFSMDLQGNIKVAKSLLNLNIRQVDVSIKRFIISIFNLSKFSSFQIKITNLVAYITITFSFLLV